MWEDDRTRTQQVPCPGGTLYQITAGDTLYELARRFGTTVNAIVAANPGINPRNLQVGQEICIPGAVGPGPCPGGTQYTIQPGDTFYRLAQRFNVSLPALIAANPGVDPNRLQVGQTICIPRPAAPELVLPCCTVLPSTQDAPEGASGAILVSELPDEAEPSRRYALTFVANGLPEPEQFGDYNNYVGILSMTPDPGEPPLRFGAILGSSESLDQPLTWCGTRVIADRPQPGNPVEIRLVNLRPEGPDIPGPILMTGDLTNCR